MNSMNNNSETPLQKIIKQITLFMSHFDFTGSNQGVWLQRLDVDIT